MLRFINEEVENQLSFLVGFKRWLLNLQMGAPVPEAKSAHLLIEAVSEIRDGMLVR